MNAIHNKCYTTEEVESICTKDIQMQQDVLACIEIIRTSMAHDNKLTDSQKEVIAGKLGVINLISNATKHLANSDKKIDKPSSTIVYDGKTPLTIEELKAVGLR